MSLVRRVIWCWTLSRTRQFATSARPIDLDFTTIVCPSCSTKGDGALVILHGLFGSKRNWATLAKAFADELRRPVYALDLRNQGTSPHGRPMTYSQMAEDVLHFIHAKSLNNVAILGHSMGGKVAMAVALHPSLQDPSDARILSKLVVADIAPVQAKLSPEFCRYVDAMTKIERLNLTSRKEASQFLEPYEKDPFVRAFLLTNLLPFTAQNPYARFRVSLDIIGEAVPDLGSFPYTHGERTWNGQTLFIKGDKSAYINRHAIPVMKQFFPNMMLETLDAGHWVHAERPQEFQKLVRDFTEVQ